MNRILSSAINLILGVFLLSCTATAAFADELDSVMASAGDLPTDITALNMSYDANRQQVIFEGNVKVRRPDFDLDSRRLIIFFEKNKTQQAKTSSANDDPLSTMGAGEIDKLVAEGNVHMVREGREGTCEKVVYYVKQELIVMEGNPVLKEKENSIKGQKINFYIKENRSEVLGGKNSPVKVRFISPKNNEGK